MDRFEKCPSSNPFRPEVEPPYTPDRRQTSYRATSELARHFQHGVRMNAVPQLTGTICQGREEPFDDFGSPKISKPMCESEGANDLENMPLPAQTSEQRLPRNGFNGRNTAILSAPFSKEQNLGPLNSSDSSAISRPSAAVLQNRQTPAQNPRLREMRRAYNSRAVDSGQPGDANCMPPVATPPPHPNSGQPPSVRGIQLVSTTNLPDQQRSLFHFPLFNAVQSKCFSTAYMSDDNLVVSAPTGSGKTVVMELGILRLIDQLRSGKAKVVYQAPTKSLCSERYRDWQAKFRIFDVECAEVTGDAESNTLRTVTTAGIIITTPEKWDSVTRKWKDHAKLMAMIRLFLADEVHILRDARGATLEAIVSRMKSVGNDIRFIALSATIPNSDDIATWITKNERNRHLPAIREVFDDTFRPVQLKKHIIGHNGPYNPWAFDAALTDKIPQIVARFSRRKPVIIFCPTKESAQRTAERLAQSWRDGQRDWDAPVNIAMVKNDQLEKVLSAGVAFHHSSLELADRKAVEMGFSHSDVSVICSTSTLAVGINLPCYLVILKGTQAYTDKGPQEYSSLEVMQMLGRAGRPQFEREACAVIMCLSDRSAKYEKMVAGDEVIESSLQHNLIEHLNAEIGIGTISSIMGAKTWLGSTFLNVRLRRSPKYYNCDSEGSGETPDGTLLRWCEKYLKLLHDSNLIQDSGKLRCTEYGDAMARYCVKFETMKIFMDTPAKAKVSEVLFTLVRAAEFREHKLKQGEKSFYKGLNEQNEIRYPIQVDLALPQHKASLILQAKLGCVMTSKDATLDKATSAQRRQLELETYHVLSHGRRLIKCMVDIFLQRNDAVAVKNALKLGRGLAAGVWDDTINQLKQIPGIGDVSVRKLAAAGIKTIDDLSNTEPRRLEIILGKNPPFGNELVKKAANFPMLHISVKKSSATHKPGYGVEVRLSSHVGFLNEDPPLRFFKRQYNILFLCETSDGEVIDFRRISPSRLRGGEDIFLTAIITKPRSTIRCHIMCDDLAGTQKFAEINSDAPASWFHSGAEALDVSFQPPKLDVGGRAGNDFDKLITQGVNDADLLAAAKRYPNEALDTIVDIDDIISGDEHAEKAKKSRKRSKLSLNEAEQQFREPHRLQNGNWTCQHTCNDSGKQCKHKCCAEGVKRKPTRPASKRPKLDDSSARQKQPTDLRQQETRPAKGQKQAGLSDKFFGTDHAVRNPQNVNDWKYANVHTPQHSSAASVRHASHEPKSPLGGTATVHSAQTSHDLAIGIEDAFDSGSYDWQAMDNIAAELDQFLDESNDKHFDAPMTGALQARSGRQQAFETNSLKNNANENNDPSLFLTWGSGRFKSADVFSLANTQDFTPPTDDHLTFGDWSKSIRSLQDGHKIMASEDRLPSPTQPESRSSSANDEQLRPADTSIIDTSDRFQTFDAEAKRLHEEDQKRRWAAHGFGDFTYDSVGKWLTIVDELPADG